MWQAFTQSQSYELSIVLIRHSSSCSEARSNQMHVLMQCRGIYESAYDVKYAKMSFRSYIHKYQLVSHVVTLLAVYRRQLVYKIA